MITLYHYVHCPYCIRVRMGLGFLNLSYNSVVLPYNDEKTPVQLTGKKMLPIVKINDQIFNESLDILKLLDKKNTLKFSLYENKKLEIENLLGKLSKPIHSLCMPYWIWTPEFDQESREYFKNKKEISKGPFSKLIQNKELYLNELNKVLEEFEKNLNPFYQSLDFTILDLIIASHLYGMYIFPEFQFSQKIHQYLQNIKGLTKFEYHQDFWKE